MEIEMTRFERTVAAALDATLPARFASRLAAFDVYVWDQCYAMEQSLRID